MVLKRSVVKSVVKILDLIAQYPDITRERLAKEVGLSVRGVEKTLDLPVKKICAEMWTLQVNCNPNGSARTP